MTTMRTTPEENVAIARFMAEKLNQAKGLVCVIFPLGGVSSIDKPGKLFYHPEANQALFHTLRQSLSPKINIVEDRHHIDDPEFALLVGTTMVNLLRTKNC
jgi:uncharacterized protein (UPF0261 family)